MCQAFQQRVFVKSYELLISNRLLKSDKSITWFLLLWSNSVRALCKDIYNKESKRISRGKNEAGRQREKYIHPITDTKL